MPVETRYFRSDGVYVNRLAAYCLYTTQSASCLSRTVHDVPIPASIGIRVWKRTTLGAMTEITAGVPVAIATVASGLPGGYVYEDGYWNCPQTPLSPLDTIVVRVYGLNALGSWVLMDTWTTEQLSPNTSQLDAVTWTVWYYVNAYWSEAAGYYILMFRFGDPTCDSRIENFSWTEAVPPVAKAGLQISEVMPLIIDE